MSTAVESPRQAGTPPEPPAPPSRTGLIFPETAYLGVAAKFAELFSQHYESPKEFLYVDCLALIGAVLSGRVRADFDLPCQPRLNVLKVAESAWRRKSTSTRFAEQFLQRTLESLGPEQVKRHEWPDILYGVGSAEGLGLQLEPRMVDDGIGPPVSQRTRRAVLVFDEFRRFEAKAGIDGSVLLPMVNELYERNQYDNITKTGAIHIRDGHLVLVSNSTEETFRGLLNAREFQDIGFLNRIFLVTSDTRKRIAQPKAPDDSLLAPIAREFAEYLAALPPLNPDGSASTELVIRLTPGARRMWEEWYLNLDETPETARLDNLGMRLMGLLAFTSGHNEIDETVLTAVLDILAYQRRVREALRPITGANARARLEQKILRALERKGPLSARDLRRYTNADRDGLKLFRDVLNELINDRDIRLRKEDKRFELVPQDGKA